MKTYKIYFSAEIDIEAKSEEDANFKFMTMDNKEFRDSFEVGDIEQTEEV